MSNEDNEDDDELNKLKIFSAGFSSATIDLSRPRTHPESCRAPEEWFNLQKQTNIAAGDTLLPDEK
jgi:hypothetical protein